jgi:hypothetical protein
MGFYRTELERFKTALSERNVDAFWIMSNENSREMRVTYTKLNNITEFIEWLEMKADMEDISETSGSVLLSIGGE